MISMLTTGTLALNLLVMQHHGWNMMILEHLAGSKKHCARLNGKFTPGQRHKRSEIPLSRDTPPCFCKPGIARHSRGAWPQSPNPRTGELLVYAALAFNDFSKHCEDKLKRVGRSHVRILGGRGGIHLPSSTARLFHHPGLRRAADPFAPLNLR